jgi:glycosyltransferase involved in cell wall biosynthesis
MKRSLFSIIIPTLNEEKFLPRLLDSLVAQTGRNFEVIVVDGSSRDKTVAVAKKYTAKLPGLKILEVKKPSLPLQRNLGAKAAKGDWYVFVDADSIFLPYFTERIAVFIEQTKTRLFTTWFRSDTDDPKDGVYTLLGNAYLEATLIFKKPLTPGPLTIVTREAFDEVGGYDEAHAYNEDVDFGLRLYKAGIHLDMLRETLCVLSLRRFRKEGTLKVLNQYIVSLFPILLFNRSMKHMPGYIMGGHLYGKKKKLRRPVLKGYEKKLKEFLKELFA